MLLASEDINEDRIVCLSNDDEDINGYELCIGKEYKRWDGKFQFYYDQDQGSKETDYLVNDMSWFLISEKLKAILDEMNTTIQYLPVQIKRKKFFERAERILCCKYIDCCKCVVFKRMYERSWIWKIIPKYHKIRNI